MPEPLTDELVQTKALAIARTFTPNAPVTERELFAGRSELLVRIVIAASQGHVAIYGRPGVGKRSLANMVAAAVGERCIVVQGCRPETPSDAGKRTLVVTADADSAEGVMPEAAGFLLPPMSTAEVREIVDRSFARVAMTIDEDAKTLIAAMAQGQPRYAHLLAQNAAVDAVLRGRPTHVARANVEVAMKRALDEMPASVKAAWRQATKSPRVSLFQEVLLACALASKNALGWFYYGDVSGPLRAITGKPSPTVRFSPHLHAFSEARGPLLERSVASGAYVFRFVNPLMESYIVFKAAADGWWDPKR